MTSLDVAETNATAQAQLEQQKFVQTTISTIIGKGTEQDQIKTLRFYARIGVIGDPYAEKILKLPDAQFPVSSVPITPTARQEFFSRYRIKFGALSDVSEIDLTRIFGFIQNDKRMTDLRQVAYVLATIQHETNKTFRPLTEMGSDEQIEARYGPSTVGGKALGNEDAGDGARYRGRGYIQLTGKSNYRRAGQALGIDLVADPEKALEPETSYGITAFAMKTGYLTGKKLDDYITGTTADYASARRIVSGNNKGRDAEQIAQNARSLEEILRAVLVDGGK